MNRTYKNKKVTMVCPVCKGNYDLRGYRNHLRKHGYVLSLRNGQASIEKLPKDALTASRGPGRPSTAEIEARRAQLDREIKETSGMEALNNSKVEQDVTVLVGSARNLFEGEPLLQAAHIFMSLTPLTRRDLQIAIEYLRDRAKSAD